MTAIIPLGTFCRVSLTDAWPTEDGNFTPWLASPQVITLLGKVLNIELEVEAVERWVGSFRADILARATDLKDHYVIIENQFGKTDHKHLGQILTYLAGVEHAKSVVWIAETIQPDHRAAIDWLNTHTSEDFSFFAVEIELWRIDNSSPAPRFNIVASPNDWARRARSAVRQVEGGEDAERFRIREAYWSSFKAFLDTQKTNFRIRRVNKDSWFSFPIGCGGFYINTTIAYSKNRIGVELYMDRRSAKHVFNYLFIDKEVIEKEFGEHLEWFELPDKLASRISVYQYGVDVTDERQYADLHAWMLSKMERFQLVFADRVKTLVTQVSSLQDESEDCAIY